MVNLLAMVRLFCSYVFSERIPYEFLFSEVEESESETTAIQGHTFRKVVTLLVHIDNNVKQIQVNIPDNLNCDLKVEDAKLK